jgi:hypothetical protein
LCEHQATEILEAIQADPINGNIDWQSIEALLVSLGCQVIKGSGSRVTFILNGQQPDFHRPYPGKEVLRYRVKQEYLEMWPICWRF